MLIVDDSQIITKRIQQLIQNINWQGQVNVANSYADALNLLNAVQYDIVLLDINLNVPNKSGIDLLEIIKSKVPATKVVMLTNHYNEHYKSICMELGAEYFLDKSNDFEQLEEVICELSNAL